MIYVFVILLIISFIKEKDLLLKIKRNLLLFMALSVCGIILGIVHIVNPYIPSISFLLEKYLK